MHDNIFDHRYLIKRTENEKYRPIFSKILTTTIFHNTDQIWIEPIEPREGNGLNQLKWNIYRVSYKIYFLHYTDFYWLFIRQNLSFLLTNPRKRYLFHWLLTDSISAEPRKVIFPFQNFPEYFLFCFKNKDKPHFTLIVEVN